jgi:hypothetical protein
LLIKLKDNSKKRVSWAKNWATFDNVIKPEAKEANISLEQQIKNMGWLLNLEPLKDARLNSVLVGGYPEGVGITNI